MKRNAIAIIILLALVGWGVYDSQSKTETAHDQPGEVKTGTQIGNRAPDFELLSLDGSKVKLSDYRGKKVLLNFWATWCPPCRAEMPHMEKFYNDYKDDIVVLAVNLTHTEQSVTDVPIFVKQFGLTFPVVLDEKGGTSSAYQVVAYPTSYMIDSNGIIREKFQGAIHYDIMKKSASGIK